MKVTLISMCKMVPLKLQVEVYGVAKGRITKSKGDLMEGIIDWDLVVCGFQKVAGGHGDTVSSGAKTKLKPAGSVWNLDETKGCFPVRDWDS